MANKMCAAFYFVVCSYLFVASVVVDAGRDNRLACAGVPNGRFLRSPKSCAHYYLCNNEAITVEGQCPEGLLFSDVKQECDWSNLVNCNSCVQYQRPYYANPKSCDTFFRCVDGIRRTYRCPHGQMFDEISNRCQASDYVDCKNEDDDDVPPIGDGTSVRPPVDNEWPMPGGEGRPTRPPPTWGPPDAPSGGDGDVGGDEEPEEPEPEPTRPTPKPGGIGTWRPTRDPDAEPTKPPPTPTREPWGPPDAPVGGGEDVDDGGMGGGIVFP